MLIACWSQASASSLGRGTTIDQLSLEYHIVESVEVFEILKMTLFIDLLNFPKNNCLDFRFGRIFFPYILTQKSHETVLRKNYSINSSHSAMLLKLMRIHLSEWSKLGGHIYFPMQLYCCIANCHGRYRQRKNLL